MPEENYQKKAKSQMQASDNNYHEESDPRMPVLKPEKVHAHRNKHNKLTEREV